MVGACWEVVRITLPTARRPSAGHAENSHVHSITATAQVTRKNPEADGCRCLLSFEGQQTSSSSEITKCWGAEAGVGVGAAHIGSHTAAGAAASAAAASRQPVETGATAATTGGGDWTALEPLTCSCCWLDLAARLALKSSHHLALAAATAAAAAVAVAIWAARRRTRPTTGRLP